jgi:proline iminopeptidase
MRTVVVFAVLVSASSASSGPGSASTLQRNLTATPRDSRIAAGDAELYSREVGRGQPMIVLHGGPDFNHSYLLPDMDRLSGSFRLIYYDQRGRGRSADRVQSDDVSLASDIADLERVRAHFQLDSVALLGHSWGTVLALEYALKYANRVSRLILMNPAPASRDDFTQFRKERFEKLGRDLDRLKAVAATAAYAEGDPDAVAAYYRIHFKGALRGPGNFEKLIASLRASFTEEGILKARAIEDRLMNDTWLSDGYDLLPKLASLRIPTLVIYGDHDFIPAATAAHITKAIPNARMVTLKGCGHFTYLECPVAVGKHIDHFFPAAIRPARPR